MANNEDFLLDFRNMREAHDGALLEAIYRDLFVPHFTDADEQEGPDDWAPRLGDPLPPTPEMHGFVAGINLDDASTRSLAGFAFVERYQTSRCALLSYIAVDCRWRGRGLARTLFDAALESARIAADANGEELLAVFAEIHNPTRVAPTDDILDPAERVRVMERLGARRLPIQYVQPALGEGKPSDRLLLIAFPQHGERALHSRVVRAFLDEYYAAQHVSPTDTALERMRLELGDGMVSLRPLPDYRAEEPQFEFTTFGIALHFVARDRSKSEAKGVPKQHEDFASFEDDLFSYSYVAERREPAPFASRTVTEIASVASTVWMRVPSHLSFESEGRQIELRVERSPCASEPRRLFFRPSRTDFQDGLTVFHLTFVGDGKPGSFLDEYDLVTLTKLWQGGEGWSAAEQLTFEWEGTSGGSIGELAVAAFGASAFADLDGGMPRVRCGTIQLLTGTHMLDLRWTDILRSVRDLTSDHHKDHVKGIGGIIQGLLDFRAIDLDELGDVFAPLEIGDADLLGVHKGTILSIQESDRVYAAVEGTIGISPYLLLPQAVLLHNEELLEESERAHRLAQQSPWVLEESLAVMRGALASYLPNVFHYPNERRLFQRGETSRSFRERRKQLVEQTAKLDARWEQRTAKRSRLSDDVRNTLLVLLAGFTIYPVTTSPALHTLIWVALPLVALFLLVWSRPWIRYWKVSPARRRGAAKAIARLTNENMRDD